MRALPVLLLITVFVLTGCGKRPSALEPATHPIGYSYPANEPQDNIVPKKDAVSGSSQQ